MTKKEESILLYRNEEAKDNLEKRVLTSTSTSGWYVQGL